MIQRALWPLGTVYLAAGGLLIAGYLVLLEGDGGGPGHGDGVATGPGCAL